MHKVSVIRVRPPVVTPGEFDVHAFLNLSQLFPPKLLPDQTITLPVIANLSVLSPLQVTTIDPILLPSFTNASSLASFTVSVAPADGTIRLPTFSNASNLSSFEIDEAPADGVIRLPSINNVSSLGSLTVSTDSVITAEPHDAVVAYHPVATVPA